jgi:hypothetical protein
MKKRVVAAITGCVWIAAIGSAVVLTYALNHPHHIRGVTSSWSAKTRVTEPRQVVEEPMVVSDVLQMPTVIVVGDLGPSGPRAPAPERGVTEMQPPDEAVAGPASMKSARPAR